MSGRMDEGADMDGNRQIEMETQVLMNEAITNRMNEWMNEWMKNEWMIDWMNEWANESTNKWMMERMIELKKNGILKGEKNFERMLEEKIRKTNDIMS